MSAWLSAMERAANHRLKAVIEAAWVTHSLAIASAAHKAKQEHERRWDALEAHFRARRSYGTFWPAQVFTIPKGTRQLHVTVMGGGGSGGGGRLLPTSFPVVDGTPGQVLISDGQGHMHWGVHGDSPTGAPL